MPCLSRYSTADQYAIFWCLDRPLDGATQATIEMFLDIAAGDINAARAATGGCACVEASWAALYMMKLNVIEAAIVHNCPCGTARLSDEMKQSLGVWLNGQLEAIRLGKIELCQGETGSESIALGIAEQGLTPWATEQIIANYLLRTS